MSGKFFPRVKIIKLFETVSAGFSFPTVNRRFANYRPSLDPTLFELKIKLWCQITNEHHSQFMIYKKNDGILLDILRWKVYEKFVSINLHVAKQVHGMVNNILKLGTKMESDMHISLHR